MERRVNLMTKLFIVELFAFFGTPHFRPSQELSHTGIQQSGERGETNDDNFCRREHMQKNTRSTRYMKLKNQRTPRYTVDAMISK